MTSGSWGGLETLLSQKTNPSNARSQWVISDEVDLVSKAVIRLMRGETKYSGLLVTKVSAMEGLSFSTGRYRFFWAFRIGYWTKKR